MQPIKSFAYLFLCLAAAVSVGWGAYHFTSPSSAAQEENSHAGHDHSLATDREEPGEHPAEEEDAHAGHGHEEDAHAGHGHGRSAAPEDPEEQHPEEEAHAAPGPGDESHHGEDDFFADLTETPVAHEEGQAPAREQDAHAGHQHGAGEDEFCPEHKLPEAEDALCQSGRVGELLPGQGLKVRLAEPGIAARIGLEAATPTPAGATGMTWPGQVVFNRDRLATLAALAPGAVKKVLVNLGDTVTKGEVLAEIASPAVAGLHAELAAAESRLELARTVFLREQDLLAKGVTSRQEFQQAEAERRQAESAVARLRQQVEDFGLAGSRSGSTLPVRAPFDGTVIERSAVQGQNVAPETVLFTLADLSTLWIEISVPEENLLEVQPGLEVNGSFGVLPGRTLPGRIFWVAPALDPKTRMLRALAEVDNSKGLLKSGLFGQVSPLSRAAADTLAVPADALQIVDGQPFLFLSLADDLYELRRVVPGRRLNGEVMIREGVTPTDRIVTAQAFALKSEVLRARLGASCADH